MKKATLTKLTRTLGKVVNDYDAAIKVFDRQKSNLAEAIALLEAEGLPTAPEEVAAKPAKKAATKVATIDEFKFKREFLRMADADLVAMLKEKFPESTAQERKQTMARYMQYKAANFVEAKPASKPAAKTVAAKTPAKRRAIASEFDAGM